MKSPLNELAERETRFARRSQSLAALNNALMLMAHDYTISEVKQILRDHADQFGRVRLKPHHNP